MSFTLKCNECGNENGLIDYWEVINLNTSQLLEEHKYKVYVDYGDHEVVCLKCNHTDGIC